MLAKKDDKIKKPLKEAVSMIIGKQFEDLVDFLDGDKYINEFLIAKKLDITINQARNLLYKLSDHGMVSSTRKKDKRKGWYTYFWKLEILKILEFLRETFVKKIEQIKHQIESREMKRFYICERCNVEYNEENALAHDFTCNECGSIFVLKDNTKIVKEFRKNLEKHLKEMELIDEEIVKEREKSGKKKLKEVKKEEEEKKKKRAEKRAATKKLKDLMKPKIKKKIAPKKASKKQKIKKVSKKKPKKRR